jgi:hypothetical protein
MRQLTIIFSFALNLLILSPALASIPSHITGLSDQALKQAKDAYIKAEKTGKIHNHHLTVVDYSKASDQKRLWVIDTDSGEVEFNTLVSHGKNSGMRMATHFSNTPQSKMSSLGAYITENTYRGHKGYSLNLNGLNKNLNSNAHSRRIVMHGASYVSPSFAKQYGRVGRSWGCLALNQAISSDVINDIKGGSLIYAYAPNSQLS